MAATKPRNIQSTIWHPRLPACGPQGGLNLPSRVNQSHAVDHAVKGNNQSRRNRNTQFARHRTALGCSHISGPPPQYPTVDEKEKVSVITGCRQYLRRKFIVGLAGFAQSEYRRLRRPLSENSRRSLGQTELMFP